MSKVRANQNERITSDHKIVVINRETHVEQNANSEARDYWGPLLKLSSVFTAANIDAQEKLVKEHGVIIRNFPKDVFNLMMSLSKAVVSETAAEGKLNKKIYESWSTFKEKARQRAAFNEHGYTNLSNTSL